VAVPQARQGEVWDVDLDPARGHEQAGTLRPCVVISIDALGGGPTELAIVVPLTTKSKARIEVEIEPPEGGLDRVSHAMPYHVRSLSRERLVRKRGTIRDDTLGDIVRRVGVLVRLRD
jgi:mRNA interferase MazF